MNYQKIEGAKVVSCLACSLEHAQRMNTPKSKNPRHEELKKLQDNFIRPMWALPKKEK